MNLMKYTLAAGAALLSCLASAQNLDPTVEVNRAYEGKLLEVHKPDLTMTVPDSIRTFDLDFDYSVFENPYQGSYDFKPYQLLMKPFSTERDFNTFWLKAGAGYTLSPELGMVWTPGFKGKFKMNVYGDYDAYIGGYRGFHPDVMDGSDVVLSREHNRGRTSLWNGYRMKTRAGVDGRVDLEKSVVSFDLAYYGIASKDTLMRRSYDSFDMNVNVASRPSVGDYFMYDVTAGYRFGEDKVKYEYTEDYMSENLFSFDASLGPVISDSHKVLFDVGFDAYFYSGKSDAVATELSFSPHYVFNKGRWNIDLGILVAKIMCPEVSVHYSVKEQIVYPDVNVSFAAIPDAMNVYGRISGGNKIHSYSSLLERNPYLRLNSTYNPFMLDASMERVSFTAGVVGRISRRFTYDIKAGFASLGNALMDGVALVPDSAGGYGYEFFYGYDSYNKLFASVDWDWHAESISFDGSVEYAHYTGSDEPGLYLPAPLTGDVAFEYNWNRRVFAGVDCRFASARKGTMYRNPMPYGGVPEVWKAKVPGFADLGIYAEYAFSHRFSLWLRGGNLMNATVQYTPLYAERGINFTAGICLKL